MKHRVEKACDTCGYRCFANCRTIVCPGAPHAPDCKGTLCSVITPLPGKRVSGVLVRDGGGSSSRHDINFIPQLSLVDAEKTSSGMWKWPVTHCHPYHYWTPEQWKEQYGKLPRKGSKCMVIIELISGQ